MRDLFEAEEGLALPIVPGAVLLRGFASVVAPRLLEDLEGVLAASTWRHMVTPGGFRMSVAMTNCGALGWVSDRTGYRYDPIDPAHGKPWPAMPASFMELARTAAAAAGFDNFEPDACLVNRYEHGARVSLDKDGDERDYSQPIVSVSLGLPAVFLFGGVQRAEKSMRLPLAHGDVVVWGGPARLHHHGILPLKDGEHPATGRYRINLTFRKAG